MKHIKVQAKKSRLRERTEMRSVRRKTLLGTGREKVVLFCKEMF